MLKFTIQSRSGRARAGLIETAHGNIETPAFIPVATKATVKALTPEQVANEVGASAILANTYHLYLQPGIEVIKKAGGLGKFMNWSGPTFTDSGGFQAFSLRGEASADGRRTGKIKKISRSDGESPFEKGGAPSEAKSGGFFEPATDNIGSKNLEAAPPDETPSHNLLAKVSDEGVSFRSIIDGSKHFFTPEKSIEIQQAIGANIIFAFDECISPDESYERQKQAVERTAIWARRCLEFFERCGLPNREAALPDQSLFGIVQGGRYQDLRIESAKAIGSMDFNGFGIRGSFDKRDIGTAVGWVCDELPEGKPRHLLGIGSEPADLILGIENGIDTFDCVAPARLGRNGSAYTSPNPLLKKGGGAANLPSSGEEGSGEVEMGTKSTINLFNACFYFRFFADRSRLRLLYLQELYSRLRCPSFSGQGNVGGHVNHYSQSVFYGQSGQGGQKVDH